MMMIKNLLEEEEEPRDPRAMPRMSKATE